MAPSSIRSLPKLEVITVCGRRGWQLFEPVRGQEEVKSKVFMLSPQGLVNYLHPCTYAYYIRVSSDNVYSAQNKISRPMALPQLQRESSGSFWFRKRFPAVSLTFEGLPDLCMDIGGAVIDFRFWMFLHGFGQFSFSSAYIIPAIKGTVELLDLHVDVSDFQYKFEQGVGEGVFSEHEWYHVMISHELKSHMPYDPKHVTSGHNRTITWTIILKSINPETYTEDIIFGNPGFGAKALFSLPSLLEMRAGFSLQRDWIMFHQQLSRSQKSRSQKSRIRKSSMGSHF